jgi:hypothetical protein
VQIIKDRSAPTWNEMVFFLIVHRLEGLQRLFIRDDPIMVDEDIGALKAPGPPLVDTPESHETIVQGG